MASDPKFVKEMHDYGLKAGDEIVSSFKQLSASQLNWKPAKDVWSVGQVIDHLTTSNALYFPLFLHVQKGTVPSNFWGKVPGLKKMFGSMLLKLVNPDNPKKNKTVKVFEPSMSEVPADILERFSRTQTDLLNWYRQIENADLDIVVTSPAGKLITYTLRDCLKILVWHERRHLNQAKNLMAMPEFPKS